MSGPTMSLLARCRRRLATPRSRGFSVQEYLLFVARAVGMEPFMELSRSERRRGETCLG